MNRFNPVQQIALRGLFDALMYKGKEIYIGTNVGDISLYTARSELLEGLIGKRQHPAVTFISRENEVCTITVIPGRRNTVSVRNYDELVIFLRGFLK